ncbi:MAG: hypothetical protein KKG73_13210 [Gammaproteobacteria bacterium]|nr:hypothetical protein [Gammaproteobacteria bacterium]
MPFLLGAALNQACGIWILNRVEDENSGLWVPSYVVDDDGSGYTEVAGCTKNPVIPDPDRVSR